MPTYQRCGKEIDKLALSILKEFPCYEDLLKAKVQIDFMFAYADRDEEGDIKGCALRCHGARALGVARRISLKDRAAGRGDAEITLDADWWQEAKAPEARAMLDHELYHLLIKKDEFGKAEKYDLGRPVILLRKHDFEFGWFAAIAERHGEFSIECTQARAMTQQAGQLLFPDFLKERAA